MINFWSYKDEYKELRKKGENIKNAILRTGAQRLRPVMLTTLTTFAPRECN